MPEEPAKLDETLDAKPYDPPKPRRSRVTLTLFAVVVLAVGAATVMAVRYYDYVMRPSIYELTEFNKTPCHVAVAPTDWSEEVNGLRCRLEVTGGAGLGALVRVKNVSKEPLIVFKSSWHIGTKGNAARGIPKLSGKSPPIPMSGPMVVCPGEECAVGGEGMYAWPGRATLWAVCVMPEGVGYTNLDERGLPRGLSPEQARKLENERIKSPGLPRTPIWHGQIETPRVSVKVERKKEAP